MLTYAAIAVTSLLLALYSSPAKISIDYSINAQSSASSISTLTMELMKQSTLTADGYFHRGSGRIDRG